MTVPICSIFFLVYSTVYATSLITNLLRRAIFTHFRWQKRQQKKWPCYSGEWKQVIFGKPDLSFLLDVFSVWKPWHCGIKKKWEGEEREKILSKKKKRGRSKGKFEWFLFTRRKLGERQTTVWTFQGGDNLVNSSSGLMMRFGKVSWTKFLVTISGQRTFAPSWEQNSTWADARIPSVSPLAFAPRSRSKSLPFHLLNLSRATSETVLHYIFVFEKKIHEIFVNQDEQRVLPIIVWTAIAVRLVKHDPWSSPASDVTVHDVILHSSHYGFVKHKNHENARKQRERTLSVRTLGPCGAATAKKKNLLPPSPPAKVGKKL